MNLARHIVTISLRLYKLAVSPLLHVLFGPMGGCRFTPTCSVYAAEAVVLHGVVRGTVLAVKRLCRCHPWGGCGDDPVPDRFCLCGAVPHQPVSEPELAANHFHTQRAVHFGCPPPR